MSRVDDTNSGLFADLYELTMAASYHAHGLDDPATFDLFVRNLPPRRGYLVSCGLDPALDYLERLHFDDDAVAYLRSLDLFDESFLSLLSTLRFTGEVRAIPEGELVFPNEPIVQVTAPLVEAQLVETFLLNCIGYETMIATKAARVATACGGRTFVDFSPRRDHGTDAALKTARAAYVGGAAGTSLVLAGLEYGLELSGTMAHSYVMRFENEADAFLTYARDFPGRAIFLIDTYDTERAARTVVELAGKLEPEGLLPRAVRLDSGDVDTLSRSVRSILDEGGLTDVHIFASGDLDEYRIERLVAAGAPVDAFGVGTQLGTSGDAPHVAVVYKLVEDADGPKVKLSTDKVTLPGRKQVFRRADDGVVHSDVLALQDESVANARPVLWPVMRDGRRIGQPEPLAALRDRCRASVAALPDRLRAVEPDGPPYPVEISPGLDALVHWLHDQLGAP
ncbi:MAG TPA: nicotinate phosphoribosyltransferase [Acidimicrobiia bacterium]|nr:nicotinate phosphoribosyltransferase [Acidimicrobiia bacterium]